MGWVQRQLTKHPGPAQRGGTRTLLAKGKTYGRMESVAVFDRQHVLPGGVAAPTADDKIEANMAIEGEVDKLCGTLQQGIENLNKKVQEATARFDAQIKDGHQVVDAVVGQADALGNALARVRAAMGLHTNFPPSDGEQTA